MGGSAFGVVAPHIAEFSNVDLFHTATFLINRPYSQAPLDHEQRDGGASQRYYGFSGVCYGWTMPGTDGGPCRITSCGALYQHYHLREVSDKTLH
jgi:hypothetical protein